MVMDMKHHRHLFLLQGVEVMINAINKIKDLYLNEICIFLQLHSMVLEKQEEHLEDLVQDTLHIKF